MGFTIWIPRAVLICISADYACVSLPVDLYTWSKLDELLSERERKWISILRRLTSADYGLCENSPPPHLLPCLRFWARPSCLWNRTWDNSLHPALIPRKGCLWISWNCLTHSSSLSWQRAAVTEAITGTQKTLDGDMGGFFLFFSFFL